MTPVVGRRQRGWLPGKDPKAVHHPAPSPRPEVAASAPQTPHVAVAGGGIAGLAAACGLAERGVRVTLVEAGDRLGGRVASWPVTHPDGTTTSMSRGFHAFFRQYYNLRALLRRADPALTHLHPIADYPLILAGGHRDSFADIPSRPPLNMLAFVARSPSFRPADLARVHLPSALGLLDVCFPRTFSDYDGISAAEVLDRLRFPAGARHLALEVFARSFFADPKEFSGGELVAMFHTYFLGSGEGLLFDVPDGDYDRVLWAPLARYLTGLGVQVQTGTRVTSVDCPADPGGALTVQLRRDGTAGPDSTGDTAGGALGDAPDSAAGQLTADAVVLALDTAALREVVGTSPTLGDQPWRARIAAVRAAPSFVVWRLWLNQRADPGRPPFLGTSNYGLLDNVSLVELFEQEAAEWTVTHGGSVVELHAYAVPDGISAEEVRADLWRQLTLIYPELADATVLADQWLHRADCPLIDTAPWHDRPEVVTPDPRVVLAGDGIRCDYPVALMERAATTGWLAANALLSSWGRPGHGLWTVPMRSRHAAVPALTQAARRVLSG